jgi:hypothetical protein
MSGDTVTAGLVHMHATWNFKNSAGATTGTQELIAKRDFPDAGWTIPNNYVWPITGGAVSPYDELKMQFENIGLSNAVISGVTLYPQPGSLLLTQTGVLKAIDPSGGATIYPYETKVFDADAKNNLNQNFPYLAGYLQTDITFRHNSSGYLIEDPYKFSVKVEGTGGITPPP